MRTWRNILSGLSYRQYREAQMAYWAHFDAVWSKYFHAWN